MMKKIILFFLIVSVLLTIFSSCKKENESDFIHYISSEPLTLDPQTAMDDNSKLIVANTFDGLTKISQNGEVLLNLAESYEYLPAEKSYEFHLKNDLKWSDGRDLTAYDFVFAFKRIFDKNTNSDGVESFFCIKNGKSIYNGELSDDMLGVEALNESTLIFELEYNYHSFLKLLASPLAMPCNKDFFDETKGKYGLEYNTVLTNGALTPYAWYHGEAIYFKKNIYHSEERTVPNSLTLFIDEDYNAPDTFISGNNDVIITEALLSGKMSSDIYNERIYGLLFNADDDLFSNLNLRKALSLAFNRDSMENNLPVGFKLNSDFFSGVSDNYNYNVSSAKEYLNNALVELDIKKISNPKIICKKNEQSKDALLFALQYWQETLNIYFIVEELEASEFDRRLENKEYSVALVDYDFNKNSISFLRDINKTLKLSDLSNNVNSYYTSESYETAKNFRDEAFKYLADELLFIPTYNNEKYIYFKKGISGLEYSSELSYIKFTNATK